MPERILIVTRHFWPENSRVNELCMDLAAAGYKTDVLCGQPSRADGEYFPGYRSFKVRRETRGKIDIYRSIDVKKGNGANLRLFLNYITFPLTSFLECKKLARFPYRAVFVYQTSPVMQCAPAFRIARKHHIPVYIYTADLWPQSLYPVLDVQSTLFRWVLDRISMHYYKKADKLICPSERIQAYFKTRLGLDNSHFPVVPLFPDPRYEQSFPDEDLLEKLAGSFNIMILGDFDGRLAVNTLVGIAERVRAGGMRNARFVVTGESPRIAELKKKVRRADLEDLFYFEGTISANDLGKYIHITDLLLTVVEPADIDEYMIPERLISYLSAGRCMAVSLSGEVKTLIRNADCGFTTEPFDEEGLYDGLRRIYQMSREERSFLGANARSYQQMYYSRISHVESIRKILNHEADPEDPSASEIRSIWDI